MLKVSLPLNTRAAVCPVVKGTKLETVAVVFATDD